MKRVPFSAARALSPRPLISVFYHLISPDPALPHVAPLYGYKSPEAFERDILFLKSQYTLASHEQVLAHAEGGADLPRNAAQVSFDDGFAECLTIVRPVLLKHQVPCTFFLVKNLLDNKTLMYRNAAACCAARLRTMDDAAVQQVLAALKNAAGPDLLSRDALVEWIHALTWTQSRELEIACRAVGFDPGAFLRDHRPYLTTDQALQLHRDGFTLGAHTCDHPRLHQLPWDTAAEQIVESCRHVAGLTGATRVPFAIPFNGLTLSRDRLDALRRDSGMIDLIYDTNNLRRERPWMVNRVWCDSPAGDSPAESNLALEVRRAHLLEPARAVVRRLKRVPR